ncbi:MAG: ATP-binding cassette domain-containing protein [Armatimonadetes bacterium]|nr:ATP-binding cassette domain-containing protein [Armatimonadota bacterium]
MPGPVPPILTCRNLRKEYPGLVALDGVSLTIAPGELHALVGENGAGKSTLVQIVAGQIAPDGGELLLDGQPVASFSPRVARSMGVAIVPQHPDLFHSLTALENLFVGEWPRGRAGCVSWREMRERARLVLAEMGVALDLNARAGDLTVAERQLLQIARALVANARLLILDEPTAPLGQEETERLFALLRRLHGRGVAMVYISHRLAEVFELAQRVTVLRDGRLVATLPLAGVSREELVRLMVGESPQEASTSEPKPVPERPPLLAVEGLTVPGKVASLSFSVAPGEVLGLAGVAGSGRNEVLRAIGGVERFAATSIRIAGKPVAPLSPDRALRAGICLVPADRHHEALVLPMAVRENLTLGSLGRWASRLGLIRHREEATAAAELSHRVAVRAVSTEQAVATLSGGNQQKVALASRLAVQPRVLLLEEPTQGVDVRARSELHRQIRDLAAHGVAILLVSSDLPELLTLSDRIVVLHRGRQVGEFSAAAATQEQVLDLALGTAERGVSHMAAGRHPRPLREAGLAALLALFCLTVGLLAPSFATFANLADILTNSSYFLIAAVGMTMVLLTAGIDISIGSMLAVCATVAGATAAAGWPVGLVALSTLAAGLALGVLNTALIVPGRIPPIIATLATLTLLRHGLIHITGGRWINLPVAFRNVGLSALLGIPLPIWVAALTALATWLFLVWTRTGRSVYAVGDNPEAAAHLGVPVSRVRATVYVLMGLLMGLSAFVYAGRWSAIQTNAGQGLEMVVITAVVVGGTNVFGGSGTILGTVLGVLLIACIGGALTPLHIEPVWEKAFQGALILVAVIVNTRQAWARTRSGRRGSC